MLFLIVVEPGKQYKIHRHSSLVIGMVEFMIETVGPLFVLMTPPFVPAGCPL
jgi:hypothetical protein